MARRGLNDSMVRAFARSESLPPAKKLSVDSRKLSLSKGLHPLLG
jgi:hypothetical protein